MGHCDVLSLKGLNTRKPWRKHVCRICESIISQSKLIHHDWLVSRFWLLSTLFVLFWQINVLLLIIFLFQNSDLENQLSHSFILYITKLISHILDFVSCTSHNYDLETNFNYYSFTMLKFPPYFLIILILFFCNVVLLSHNLKYFL